jgi:hypothetical protein
MILLTLPDAVLDLALVEAILAIGRYRGDLLPEVPTTCEDMLTFQR